MRIKSLAVQELDLRDLRRARELLEVDEVIIVPSPSAIFNLRDVVVIRQKVVVQEEFVGQMVFRMRRQCWKDASHAKLKPQLLSFFS